MIDARLPKLPNLSPLYITLLGLAILLNAYVFLTPFLAFSDFESTLPLYDAGHLLCHQKISRSNCIFQGANGYYFGDCTAQNGTYIQSDSGILSSTKGADVGYKFPVCSRDIGIYTFLLLGLVAYPFVFDTHSLKVPNMLWFVLAIAPLGIDGTLQLAGSLGYPLPIIGFYESTNLIRLLTGLPAGLALAIYIIPIVNNLMAFFVSESKGPFFSQKRKPLGKEKV